MKISASLMMIFFSSCLLNNAEAAQEKLYVSQDAIELQANAIVLKLEQGPVAVSTLHVDEDGYYAIVDITEEPSEPSAYDDAEAVTE